MAGEQEYPEGHPAHRATRGKDMTETHTDFGYDYPRNHPARGGQGQPVPTEMVSGLPQDGFKHLHGLPGATLAEVENAFRALSAIEQDRRAKWNEEGIPLEAIERV